MRSLSFAVLKPARSLALVAALQLLPATAQAATSVRLFASPAGHDASVCPREQPCSLGAAIIAARSAGDAIDAGTLPLGDVEVVLLDGTYRAIPGGADQPLIDLGPDDSGPVGATLVLRADLGATPILSGGTPIAGFAPCGGGRYCAATTHDFRELFVNGVRRRRAGAELQRELRNEYTPTLAGLESGQPLALALAQLPLPELAQVEVVFHAPNWAHSRCPLAGARPAASGAVELLVSPACWNGALGWLGLGGTYLEELRPIAFEGAISFLDEPGEWLRDRATGVVHYLPLPDENLATAMVVASRLTTIVRAAGELDEETYRPVERLRIEGLTVAHSGWTGPSEPSGMVIVQNDLHLGDTSACSPSDDSCIYADGRFAPAAVELSVVRDVVVRDNRFRALAGNGVDVGAGAKRVVLAENLFEDVGMIGLRAGDAATGHPCGDAPCLDHPRMAENIRIEDNHFASIASAYPGGVGLQLQWARDVRVAHNGFRDLPYTGVSSFVGFGEEDPGTLFGPDWQHPTYRERFQIVGNRFDHVMNLLNDGGAIYVAGGHRGSTIRDNYVASAGHPPIDPAVDYQTGLYLEAGSQGWWVERNVFANIQESPSNWWVTAPAYLVVIGEWYGVDDACNITLMGNFTNDSRHEAPHGGFGPFACTTLYEPPRTDPQLLETIYVAGDDWPESALAVQSSAGPRPGLLRDGFESGGLSAWSEVEP